MGQPIRQERRRRKEVFEVVDDEKEIAIGQVILHDRQTALHRRIGNTKGARHRESNLVWIAQIPQRHEGQSVRKTTRVIFGNTKREPGLADPSRSGERDQPHAGALQQVADCGPRHDPGR